MSVLTPPPVQGPAAYQPPPPHGRGDAKADAKAAAKAQRPWFKKKRFMLLGVLVLIGVVIAANSGGSKSPPSASSPGTSSAPTAVATTAASKAPATTAPATTAGATTAAATAGGAPLPIQNGDWRLDSIRVQNDGLGDFGGSARVTYTGKDTTGAGNLFTVTVFKGTRDIAVLNGSADSVAPGKAVTVQFISSDKFVAGPYTYDFQKDL